VYSIWESWFIVLFLIHYYLFLTVEYVLRIESTSMTPYSASDDWLIVGLPVTLICLIVTIIFVVLYLFIIYNRCGRLSKDKVNRVEARYLAVEGDEAGAPAPAIRVQEPTTMATEAAGSDEPQFSPTHTKHLPSTGVSGQHSVWRGIMWTVDIRRQMS